MIQNTQESVPKTSILSEKLFLGIKWLIFGIILWILIQTFQQKIPNISSLIFALEKAIVWENIVPIMLLTILVLINWGFEAKKWQILVYKIEPLSFTDAYRSILVGLSLGFITPANIGDYAGRMWQLKSDKKVESIGANLLGNGIQFYVSLIFGAISYIIIWEKILTIIDQVIFGLVIFCLFLGIIVYHKRIKFIEFLQKHFWIKPYHNHLNALISFTFDEIKQVFGWSILRYLTFSLQFVIVFQIFAVNINWFDLWAVSCLIFLFKTIIPVINFIGDLGVREYAALHFFGLFSVNISAIITATFFLWFINILLPVLMGSFLFLRLKNK